MQQHIKTNNNKSKQKTYLNKNKIKNIKHIINQK